jgi:hypothetical protein
MQYIPWLAATVSHHSDIETKPTCMLLMRLKIGTIADVTVARLSDGNRVVAETSGFCLAKRRTGHESDEHGQSIGDRMGRCRTVCVAAAGSGVAVVSRVHNIDQIVSTYQGDLEVAQPAVDLKRTN